jgi:hypothetical protein
MAVVTNLEPVDHLTENILNTPDHLKDVPANTHERLNSQDKKPHILDNLNSR